MLCFAVVVSSHLALRVHVEELSFDIWAAGAAINKPLENHSVDAVTILSCVSVLWLIRIWLLGSVCPNGGPMVLLWPWTSQMDLQNKPCPCRVARNGPLIVKVRDVKRIGLARNWTVQIRNRPKPLITQSVTILIGLWAVIDRFRNMNPLNHNRSRPLPLWTDLEPFRNRPGPPKIIQINGQILSS